MALVSTLILTVLGLLTHVRALPRARNDNVITFTPCPELNQNITILNGLQGATFDCANLVVPLDYNDSNSQSLTLDLFRVNATAEPVLGTVLINFGGPGGTGAQNLPVFATQMAHNIGDQWNLVSWDPRGTGKTIPFDCKLGSEVTTSNNRKRATEVPASANLTEYFLNSGWTFAGAVADQCLAVAGDVGRFISTASVARDMIQIVDALGEDGLLRYYGWSYGTALGSYVAAMFPDRVERMVLDGNLDPNAYQAGHYGDFLQDADKVFLAFLQECLDNRSRCSLAQYTNANSTDDLLNALNVVAQPLAINASDSDLAWAIYTSVKQAIYQNLYFPASWPATADLITSFLNGTYNAMAGSPNTTVEPYDLGLTSPIGIRAADAVWRTDSVEEYLPRVQAQEGLSSFDMGFPSLWISARWKINATERYEGDFKKQTRHPILYINGEYDPVTPIANAYSASQGFEGSVVLRHTGYGHGSVVDLSECVGQHAQAYFKDGVLPPAGLRCEPDKGPWEME